MKNLKINWKTTISGGIILLTFLAHAMFPAIVTGETAGGVITLATTFGLVSAKDGDVTGIGSQATTEVSNVLPVLDQLTANSNNPTMKDVHQVIDKLSTAFVDAARVNAIAVANTAVPAPAAPVVENVINEAPADPSQQALPLDNSANDSFETTVQKEVARRLALLRGPNV